MDEEFCLGCYTKLCAEEMYNDQLARENLKKVLEISYNTDGTIRFDEYAVCDFVDDLENQFHLNNLPCELTEEEKQGVFRDIAANFLFLIQKEHYYLPAFSAN